MFWGELWKIQSTLIIVLEKTFPNPSSNFLHFTFIISLPVNSCKFFKASVYILTWQRFPNTLCYFCYVYVLIFLAIGGSVGAFIAYRIPMTAMPELVAGFHSLVGLAAVFVAAAAFYDPVAFSIGKVGSIKTASLVEMSIGTFIGAITFSGSVLAFGLSLAVGSDLTFASALDVGSTLFFCFSFSFWFNSYFNHGIREVHFF